MRFSVLYFMCVVVDSPIRVLERKGSARAVLRSNSARNTINFDLPPERPCLVSSLKEFLGERTAGDFLVRPVNVFPARYNIFRACLNLSQAHVGPFHCTMEPLLANLNRMHNLSSTC
ncbi:hypothetical protein E2C01_076808 [Portunus trituberculatus]|uniref:Uncharacterized protein n=1 Tax=Portunus trituberculatus TaxID=210409 RepID=A0A5B7I9P8_PORTR|nr:hypothetical protein [Portunus trituberculatus]